MHVVLQRPTLWQLIKHGNGKSIISSKFQGMIQLKPPFLGHFALPSNKRQIDPLRQMCEIRQLVLNLLNKMGNERDAHWKTRGIPTINLQFTTAKFHQLLYRFPFRQIQLELAIPQESDIVEQAGVLFFSLGGSPDHGPLEAMDHGMSISILVVYRIT